MRSMRWLLIATESSNCQMGHSFFCLCPIWFITPFPQLRWWLIWFDHLEYQAYLTLLDDISTSLEIIQGPPCGETFQWLPTEMLLVCRGGNLAQALLMFIIYIIYNIHCTYIYLININILYYIILYYIILYYVISYYIILYYIISYHIISYYIILYCIIFYYIKVNTESLSHTLGVSKLIFLGVFAGDSDSESREHLTSGMVEAAGNYAMAGWNLEICAGKIRKVFGSKLKT
jgi:hypothetical protein